MSDSADYSTMSNEELLSLYATYTKEAETYNCRQLVEKILLNSLYGAMGSPFFVLYNKDIARAITLMGQVFINKAAIAKNEYIGRVMGETTPKDRRIYSDTDSVTGDTTVVVDGKERRIDSLFDLCSTTSTMNNKIIAEPDNCHLIRSVTGDTELKYVMAHKVNKELFEISCNGKTVIMTEDHSVMVRRNGNIISVSPADIKETDELIINQ